ncbi:MAG TPA: DUF4397 domain-containing protein [Candidatus Saccharimonadales bacterium]|nr:DUF4397 domain-containing protein [Candidatus Saccharimonadales bacterium]
MRSPAVILAIAGLGAMLATGCGSGGGAAPPPTYCRVRMANMAPGIAATDMSAGGHKIGVHLAFGTASGYVTLATSTVSFRAYQPDTTVLLADDAQGVPLAPDRDYTCFLHGPIGGAYSVNAVVIDDRAAVPANKAKIRFFHLAPDLSAKVRVILDASNYYNVEQYDMTNDYQEYAPGTYNTLCRLASDTTGALAQAQMQFLAGQRYTLVFSGVSSGGPAYRLIQLVDSLPSAPQPGPFPTAPEHLARR